MTEEAEGERERRSGARVTDEAIAASSPDFNLMMVKVGRYLLRPMDGTHWGAIFGTFTRTVSGMWVISLLIFFVVGLPAVNGATIFFQSLDEGRAKERQFQLQMFQLQTDLEIKKLDRTMLGDGAMKTLMQISEKLDAQSEAVKQQGTQLDKLSSDVASLKREQNGFRAQQNEMRQRMEQRR